MFSALLDGLLEQDHDAAARILTKAVALSGDPRRAVVWFRYEPIAGFDYKTAEELVIEGRAAAVLVHLEDLVQGGYA